METSYPEKTRVSCPSRAENTPTRYKSPKVGFPGLGSRKFTSWRAKSQVGAPSPDLARANWEVGARQLGSWRAPSPDLARQLATWRAPNVPPPIKPSTCIPLLSLEIPSLTCPCTLGTKKALFHLFLINVQKTANVQEAVKSIKKNIYRGHMPCSAWTKTPLFSMYPLCFVHDDSQTEKTLLYNPQSRLSERITSPHPFRVRSPLPPFTRTLGPAVWTPGRLYFHLESCALRFHISGLCAAPLL